MSKINYKPPSVGGAPKFRKNKLNEFIVNEITASNGAGLCERRAQQMTDISTEAVKHIENTNKALQNAVDLMDSLANNCAERAKRHTSNLKNVQNQLADAILNINKKIKPAELEMLANNAERLVGALQQLNELDKQGALAKFASMLEAGK